MARAAPRIDGTSVDERSRRLVGVQGEVPFSPVARVTIVRFSSLGRIADNAAVEVRLRDGSSIDVGSCWPLARAKALGGDLARVLDVPLGNAVVDPPVSEG